MFTNYLTNPYILKLLFSETDLGQGWGLKSAPLDKLRRPDSASEEENPAESGYDDEDEEQDDYDEDDDTGDKDEEKDENNESGEADDEEKSDDDDIENDDEDNIDDEDNEENIDDNENSDAPDNDDLDKNENELNLKDGEKNPQNIAHGEPKLPGPGGSGTAATGEASAMAGAQAGSAAATEAGAAAAAPAAGPVILGCLIILIIIILIAFIFSALGDAAEIGNPNNNPSNPISNSPNIACENYAFPVGNKNAKINFTHHSYSALDVSLTIGTNLYAITNGTAYLLSTNKNTNKVITYYENGIKKFKCDSSSGSNMGVAIEIKGDDGYSYRYLHLNDWDKKITSSGTRVSAGEYIGKSGNSGCSTGPHLHLDIKNSSGRFLPGTTIHGYVPNNWDCGTRTTTSFQVQCDSFKIFMDALKTLGPEDTCPSPGT